MKKAMISQPMADKTEQEILDTRTRATEELTARGYEIVDTYFADEWFSNAAMKERGVVSIPLCFMAKSLEKMSECHAVYFCADWHKNRGCRIEHAAAVAYNVERIYEQEEDDE